VQLHLTFRRFGPKLKKGLFARQKKKKKKNGGRPVRESAEVADEAHAIEKTG
jgi:hypothetical protein